MSVNIQGDSEQLITLGIEPKFDRSMSMLQNFALGFTYLSPVVGAYTLFDSSLATGGPPMIWTYLIAGAGQLLVALIFGELVSQYPLAGGLYPWAGGFIWFVCSFLLVCFYLPLSGGSTNCLCSPVPKHLMALFLPPFLQV